MLHTYIVVVGIEYYYVDTFETNRFVFCREVVLFQRQFFIGWVYTSTFGLSFVGSFVLFRSVCPLSEVSL